MLYVWVNIIMKLILLSVACFALVVSVGLDSWIFKILLIALVVERGMDVVALASRCGKTESRTTLKGGNA